MSPRSFFKRPACGQFINMDCQIFCLLPNLQLPKLPHSFFPHTLSPTPYALIPYALRLTPYALLLPYSLFQLALPTLFRSARRKQCIRGRRSGARRIRTSSRSAWRGCREPGHGPARCASPPRRHRQSCSGPVSCRTQSWRWRRWWRLFYKSGPNLVHFRDFGPGIVDVGEHHGGAAKNTVLQGHPFIDRHVVLDFAAPADGDIRPDHDVLADVAALADFRSGEYVGKMPDFSPGADNSAGVDDRGVVHKCARKHPRGWVERPASLQQACRPA